MSVSAILKEHEHQSEWLLAAARKVMPELHRLWSEVPDAYPNDYQQITPKSAALIAALPLLADSHVMDIGSNAGLYSLLAARHAASVIGVDPSEPLVRRAEAARNYFEDNAYSVHNARFQCANFADVILDAKVDAVIASLVLYHLGDENISVLKDYLATQCSKVLIQCRPERMEAFKRHPEWGKVSTTTVYNGLYKIEDCLELLRDCGFSSALVMQMDAYYYEHFPVLYAEK